MKRLLVLALCFWFTEGWGLDVSRPRRDGGFGRIRGGSSVARGGVVGNGGGVAEGYFTFAFLNLEKYISLCLATESCQVSGQERMVLRAIRESLPRERLSKEPLVFKSEKKEPGFFVLEGAVRLAKTGDDVGSPVYLNTDLLYGKGPLGNFVSIPFSSVVTTLIHELGHHQGQKNHLFLDRMGSRVATLLMAQSQEISVSPFDNNVIATTINFNQVEGNFTQLLVTDGLKTMDFSEDLKKSLHCEGGDSQKIDSLLIWNLHWMREKLNISNVGGDSFLPLRGQMVVQCVYDKGSRLKTNQDLVVELSFSRDDRGFLRLADPMGSIRQIDCTKKGNDCH